MPEISFLFSVSEKTTKYFGKIVSDYFRDDYEGVDNEIYITVKKCLNKYLYSKSTQDNRLISLFIGILEVVKDKYLSQHKETKIFDLYINENHGYFMAFGEKFNYS